MRRIPAALAGLAALACAAALTAPAATSCSFSGARWHLAGFTGTTYEVKGLRGVTCAQAITLARPLTRKRSNGLQTRVPAPRGWLCLSYSPRGSKVARGACAKLGRRVVWDPRGGEPAGGGGPKNPPKNPQGGGKPPLRRP